MDHESMQETRNDLSAADPQDPCRISFKQAIAAMETRMAAFYRRMSDAMPKARSKAILQFLAEEEEKHAARFARMGDFETTVESLNRAFRNAGPIMSSLVNDVVSAEALAAGPNTEVEILKLAVQCQKDCILFFHEMMKTVDDAKATAHLESTIEIEYKHLNELYVLQSLLTREIKAYRRPSSVRIPRCKG